MSRRFRFGRAWEGWLESGLRGKLEDASDSCDSSLFQLVVILFYLKFFKNFIYLFLAVLHGLLDLSSPTRD